MPPTTRRTRSAAQKAEKAEAAKPYAAPVESATKQRAVTRKPRAKKKAPIPTPESDESLPDAGADANAGADEEEKEEEEITDKPSYWLMKAEPETRIENGIDVKFSIDDLAAREEPEPWDGIRNYGARNNLRAMKKGDKAFFYHSNCKPPGIAGVMTIVKSYSPDWTALDSKSAYFDSAAPKDGSKWSLVHVRIEHKFPQLVSLNTLREMQKSSVELDDMQLLRQSRLSVSKVSPGEWLAVMAKAESLAAGAEWEKSIKASKLVPNYKAI